MTGDLFPEVSACDDNDKRYSTHELMAHAQRITGVRFDEWDLDVAADAESHWAPSWYSAVEHPDALGVDGLSLPWFPDKLAEGDFISWKVWANVPFSDPEAWLRKAWHEAAQPIGRVDDPLICMVLPSDRTDKPWWQELVEPYRDGRSERRLFELFRRREPLDDRCRSMTLKLEVHHLPGRIRYGCPGNTRAAGVGQPMFGTSLLVWR